MFTCSVSGQSPTGIYYRHRWHQLSHIRKPSLTDRIVSLNKSNRVPHFCFHHSQCFLSPSIKGIQHDKVVYTIFFTCMFVLLFTRKKRTPRRFDAGSNAYHPQTPKEYFKQQYFESLDILINELGRRFKQERERSFCTS